MELHELKPAKGSTKKGKRIARGQGSGKGGTATRGHKGAKSRSGYSRKRNFEMPLQMRLPKRGFKSPNRIAYVALNVGKITALAEKYGLSTVSPEELYKLGLIKKNDVVKVLGSGDLGKAVNVTAHAFSASAKTKIEASGGTVVQL